VSLAQINVRLLNAEARVPSRAHEDDAGADLHACEAVSIPPGERRDVGTGLALAIPPGFAGFVQARSGLAFRNGLMVVNAPGLIDSGYRGEVRVCLFNSDPESFEVVPGDRIAQLVIQRVEAPEFAVVDDLDDTTRGAGGFGSTG
jgi:dUTP pyrophosphatase